MEGSSAIKPTKITKQSEEESKTAASMQSCGKQQMRLLTVSSLGAIFYKFEEASSTTPATLQAD